MAPPQLILTAGLLSLASGLVAFAVSYEAYRYYRLSKLTVLAYISFGFMLLGISLILEGLLTVVRATGVGSIVEDARLVYIMNIIYLLLTNVAFLILVIGYTREAYMTVPELVIPFVAVSAHELAHYFLLRHLVFDASQLVSLLLLSMLVYEGALVGGGKQKFSLLVLISFSLLLIAHTIMLYSSIIFVPFYYIVGQLVQFVSFATLLLFLVRGARIA